MHITTRAAVHADMEFARSVHHRAYREVVLQQFGLWEEKAQDEFFAKGWSAAPHEIVLCDELPIGYICVEYSERVIHVRELVIDPDGQGQGVGTYILRGVLEHARVRQVPVRLGALHANRAVNLYRRLGFLEYGRTDTHILMESRIGC